MIELSAVYLWAHLAITISIFMTATLLYFRNKSGLIRLKQHIATSAKWEEASKALSAKLESQEQTLSNMSVLEKKLKKDLETKTKKIAEHSKLWDQQKTKNQSQQAKLLENVDHLDQQVQALTEQLKETEARNRDLSLQIQDTNQKRHAKKLEITKPFEKQIKDLKQQKSVMAKDNKQLQNQLSKQDKQLKALDPNAFKRAKVKASHFQHVFLIAKGQKELVEERLQNWETALNTLATNILKKHKKTTDNVPLGKKVAVAMELLGSQNLVEDEFSKPVANDSKIPAQQLPS